MLYLSFYNAYNTASTLQRYNACDLKQMQSDMLRVYNHGRTQAGARGCTCSPLNSE